MIPDPEVGPAVVHVRLDPNRPIVVLEHVGRILGMGVGLSWQSTR